MPSKPIMALVYCGALISTNIDSGNYGATRIWYGYPDMGEVIPGKDYKIIGFWESDGLWNAAFEPADGTNGVESIINYYYPFTFHFLVICEPLP